MPNDVLNRRIIGSPNATLVRLLSEAKIPGGRRPQDGTLTVTSSACVSSKAPYGAVGANTADGRDVSVGGIILPGAALRAERATTGTHGALTAASGLASLTTAAGAYPTVRTLIENSANSIHNATSGLVALTDGVNYTTSIRYKPNGVSARNIALYVADGSDTNRVFITVDRNTLAVANNSAGTASIVRSSARLLPDGYIFCQLTYIATAWGGTCAARAYVVNGVSTAYLGDGISGIDTTAIQTELGECPTMPLAWDGSAGVTRVAQLNSWNQGLDVTAGTIIACAMPYGRSGTVGPANASIFENSAGNTLHYYTPATQNYGLDRNDSIPTNRAVPVINLAAIAGGQAITTYRFDSTNRLTINGATTTSAAGTLPWATAATTYIGNRLALDRYFDGWVFIMKFSRVLSDAELAILNGSVRIL